MGGRDALAPTAAEHFPPMAGRGCGIIGDVVPAADVVRRVDAEARAVLDRLAALCCVRGRERRDGVARSRHARRVGEVVA